LSGPEPSLYFRSNADLDRFFRIALNTYAIALTAIEAGARVCRNDDQGNLIGKAVVRMLQYEADRAAELTDGGKVGMAEIEAELEKIWPLFSQFIDEQLAEAGKMIEKRKAEQKPRPN